MSAIKPRLVEIQHKVTHFLEIYFSGESINFRQILSIMLPILVDQTFILGLNMLNTAMISSSGVYAVSAVNMVDSLNTLLLSVLIAVATGGTVIVAQYKGSGNREMVSKSTAQAVAAVPLLGITIAALLIIFRFPILSLLFGHAEQQVLDNAQIYLLGSALSYPAYALNQAGCYCLRGASKTRPALAISLVINASYVLLNLLFINILEMGVLGMAISLNTARILGAVTTLVYLTKFDTELGFRIRNALRLDFSMQKRILFIGVPFAMEQLFFNGGKLLTQTFIVDLGTLALTANAISWSLILILQIPCNTICQASITVVGQCMGRRLVADSRKFIKSFVMLSNISLVLFFLLILPFLPALVGLFSPPAEIIPPVYQIVMITGITQPLVWSMSFVIPAAIRAAGDSKFTSFISLCSMWIIRIGMGYVLAIPMQFGLLGIYLAMIMEWACRSVVFIIRLRGNKWYAHHLID